MCAVRRISNSMHFSLEMASQDRQLHPCNTDSENTSLLVNSSNISLLFQPDTFIVIAFAGALREALAYCVHLNTELFSCADGTLLLLDTKHSRAALDSRGSTVSCCFHQHGMSRILKKPGPRGVKKSGPLGSGLKNLDSTIILHRRQIM